MCLERCGARTSGPLSRAPWRAAAKGRSRRGIPPAQSYLQPCGKTSIHLDGAGALPWPTVRHWCWCGTPTSPQHPAQAARHALSTPLYLPSCLPQFLFGVMGAFVDAATRAKFVAAGQGRARTTLLAHMHPLQLPERWGRREEGCGGRGRGGERAPECGREGDGAQNGVRGGAGVEKLLL